MTAYESLTDFTCAYNDYGIDFGFFKFLTTNAVWDHVGRRVFDKAMNEARVAWTEEEMGKRFMEIVTSGRNVIPVGVSPETTEAKTRAVVNVVRKLGPHLDVSTLAYLVTEPGAVCDEFYAVVDRKEFIEYAPKHDWRGHMAYVYRPEFVIVDAEISTVLDMLRADTKFGIEKPDRTMKRLGNASIELNDRRRKNWLILLSRLAKKSWTKVNAFMNMEYESIMPEIVDRDTIRLLESIVKDAPAERENLSFLEKLTYDTLRLIENETSFVDEAKSSLYRLLIATTGVLGGYDSIPVSPERIVRILTEPVPSETLVEECTLLLSPLQRATTPKRLRRLVSRLSEYDTLRTFYPPVAGDTVLRWVMRWIRPGVSVVDHVLSEAVAGLRKESDTFSYENCAEFVTSLDDSYRKKIQNRLPSSSLSEIMRTTVNVDRFEAAYRISKTFHVTDPIPDPESVMPVMRKYVYRTAFRYSTGKSKKRPLPDLDTSAEFVLKKAFRGKEPIDVVDAENAFKDVTSRGPNRFTISTCLFLRKRLHDPVYPNSFKTAYPWISSTHSSNEESCTICASKVADVVVSGCRHLCLCSDCDEYALTCPVCDRLIDRTVRVVGTVDGLCVSCVEKRAVVKSSGCPHVVYCRSCYDVKTDDACPVCRALMYDCEWLI